jgi:hypothetical protein
MHEDDYRVKAFYETLGQLDNRLVVDVLNLKGPLGAWVRGT